ncbi:MAG: hypothetical protein IKV98_09970 [Clostridia bacterium]|nr:hypothetical protein [Clostridia bacterium]
MNLKDLNVNFDFTTDSADYWENFWERNNGLGAGGSDPDVASKTLQEYHCVLWSKKLPNGEDLMLTKGAGSCYLTWNEFRFGSDSITESFRYNKYRTMIEKIKMFVPNYNEFIEDYIRKSYTIGGSIIFPKRMGGINQSRGCHPQIKDRWDLTLECIRKFYNDEENPLAECLDRDRKFFELFVDFKGYVDYFFLQDCVSEDYSSVLFWLEDEDHISNPLPQNPTDYVKFIEKELNFVQKRNGRIEMYINSQF